MRPATKTALLIGVLMLVVGGLCALMMLSVMWLTQRQAAPTPMAASTADPFPGLLITAVSPDSPGARAGLQPGYVLLTANNAPIDAPETLAQLLAEHNPGDAIVLVLLADGQRRQTTAVRAETPPYLGIEVIAYEGVPYETPLPAATATAVPTPPAATAPNTPLPTISRVLPDTPAAEADLQPGDVITAVDGNAILNEVELATAVAAKAPGDTITLTLRRGPDTLTRTLVLGVNATDPTRGFIGIEIAR